MFIFITVQNIITRVFTQIRQLKAKKGKVPRYFRWKQLPPDLARHFLLKTEGGETGHAETGFLFRHELTRTTLLNNTRKVTSRINLYFATSGIYAAFKHLLRFSIFSSCPFLPLSALLFGQPLSEPLPHGRCLVPSPTQELGCGRPLQSVLATSVYFLTCRSVMCQVHIHIEQCWVFLRRIRFQPATYNNPWETSQKN